MACAEGFERASAELFAEVFSALTSEYGKERRVKMKKGKKERAVLVFGLCFLLLLCGANYNERGDFEIVHLKSFDATKLGVGKTHFVSLSADAKYLYFQTTNSPLIKSKPCDPISDTDAKHSSSKTNSLLYIVPKASFLRGNKSKKMSFGLKGSSAGTIHKRHFWTVEFYEENYTFYQYALRKEKLVLVGSYPGKSPLLKGLKGIDSLKPHLNFCFYSDNLIYLTWWQKDHDFNLYLFFLDPKNKTIKLKEKVKVERGKEPFGLTVVDYFLVSCNNYWKLHIIDPYKSQAIVYTKEFSGSYPGPLPEAVAIAYDGHYLWTYNWDSNHSETIELWKIKVPQTAAYSY